GHGDSHAGLRGRGRAATGARRDARGGHDHGAHDLRPPRRARARRPGQGGVRAALVARSPVRAFTPPMWRRNVAARLDNIRTTFLYSGRKKCSGRTVEWARGTRPERGICSTDRERSPFLKGLVVLASHLESEIGLLRRPA